MNRQLRRTVGRQAENRAAKLYRQALGSMYVMEKTFWDTVQGFPLRRRIWIAVRLVLKRMQPAMHEKEGSADARATG